MVDFGIKVDENKDSGWLMRVCYLYGSHGTSVSSASGSRHIYYLAMIPLRYDKAILHG